MRVEGSLSVSRYKEEERGKGNKKCTLEGAAVVAFSGTANARGKVPINLCEAL